MSTANDAATAASFRIATVALTCALIGIVYFGQLSADMGAGRWLWTAIITMPLWLPLPWLIRGNRFTYAAMTLCVIPYFVLGVTEAVANPAARWWAGLCLIGALALFVVLIAYLRLTRVTSSPLSRTES